jgi:hypothetical protein
MLALSIAGTLIGGIHYLAVDLPKQQMSLSQPANGFLPTACENQCGLKYDIYACRDECFDKYADWSGLFQEIFQGMCNSWCNNNIQGGYNDCKKSCEG